MFKCIVTVLKVYCVGTEGIYVNPIHVFTRVFDVTYLNTENYMTYIAFLQHPDLKEKRKKIDLPTLPVFKPKGQTNLYFLGLMQNQDLYLCTRLIWFGLFDI